MVEHRCSEGDGFVSLSFPKETTSTAVEMNGRAVAMEPLYVAVAKGNQEYQNYVTKQCMWRMARVGALSSPPISPHQPAFPVGYHPNYPVDSEQSSLAITLAKLLHQVFTRLGKVPNLSIPSFAQHSLPSCRQISALYSETSSLTDSMSPVNATCYRPF